MKQDVDLDLSPGHVFSLGLSGIAVNFSFKLPKANTLTKVRVQMTVIFVFPHYILQLNIDDLKNPCCITLCHFDVGCKYSTMEELCQLALFFLCFKFFLHDFDLTVVT